MPEYGILSGMDIRILRYFLAVADEGNITRAAERMHVSQPALTSDVYLAWRKNAVLSPAAAAFVATVRNISSGR